MTLTSKIYILSTGRCGSSFISKIIREICGKDLVPHQNQNARLINIIGNLVVAKIIPASVLNRVLELDPIDSLPFNTADPLLSLAIIEYLKRYRNNHNYKIIHLVRDPREYVRSFMNWKNRKTSGIIAHHLTPFWQPSPLFNENYNIIKRLMMGKYEHFCWVWNFKNSFIEKSFLGYSNYNLVKLEEIISNDLKIFDLLNFLDIDIKNKDIIHTMLKQKVNISKKKQFPDWRQGDPVYANKMAFHCHKLMTKYRYGEEEQWKKITNEHQNNIISQTNSERIFKIL